jgi:MSHA pilin protein MshD
MNARHTSSAGQQGFTLIEALIATLVLAVATVGIAQLLAVSAQQASTMRNQAVSLELARQLMEEIASKQVADASGNISLGHEVGETTRSQYDQIDDYNGYTDTSDTLTMLDGTPVSLGSGATFTRTVSVEYRATPSGSATASPDAAFCVVTVTVTAPNQPASTLVRLFTRTNEGV